MKQKLLSATIITASAFSTAAIAGDVIVYGKLNLSYNQIEKDQAGVTKQDNWELESFASRLGFKGKEAITDNLSAIYKLEYQVVPDGEGGDREFKARNSYIGLQGSWGTMIGGTHDTPTKMSQGKVDVFNDYSLGDIALSIPGERRENDILLYKTPDYQGLSFALGIMPGDDSGADGQSNKNDGFADQVSAALTYKKDALYVGLGIDDNVNGMDIVRLTSTYQLGPVQVGAMYQQAEETDLGYGKSISDNVKGPIHDVLTDYAGAFIAKQQESFLVSAAWKIENVVLKAQIIDSTYESKRNELDNMAITVGADYKFSKRTKIYAHYSQLTVDKNTKIGLNKDYQYTGTGLLGMEHKF